MRKASTSIFVSLLAILLAGCVSTNTERNPAEIEYKEITSAEYVSKSKSSSDLFSSLAGYKITDVRIYSIEIKTENEVEKILFKINGAYNISTGVTVDATDYVRRTNQSAQDLKKRLDSLKDNSKYNGHYTLYVYGEESGNWFSGYIRRKILYDIEGVPSQEQLDAEAAEEARIKAEEEKARAEKAAAEEKAKAEKKARQNARGKEIAKGYVYHGIDESDKNCNLFSNGALESGHAYYIPDFVVKYGGSMAAIESGDGFFFKFQSSAVYVDYINQKVKGEVVNASVTSIFGQRLELPVAVVVAGGKRPIVLGLVEETE